MFIYAIYYIRDKDFLPLKVNKTRIEIADTLMIKDIKLEVIKIIKLLPNYKENLFIFDNIKITF